MSDVGRYRKLYARLWRHPGFVGLTEGEKTLALYVITGPQTNRLGLYVFSIATAGEDLGTLPQTLSKRLANVCLTFGWLFDSKARVIYLPSWFKWNPPENLNVMKGSLKDLNEIPPCALVEAFARNIETLPETLRQTFLEGLRQRLPKRSPNQEQYPYPYPEPKPNPEPALTRGSAGAPRRVSRVFKAQNEEPKEQGIEGTLISIARETLKLTNPDGPIEELVDAFNCTAGHTGSRLTFTKADAVQALGVVLSERRTNAS